MKWFAVILLKTLLVCLSLAACFALATFSGLPTFLSVLFFLPAGFLFCRLEGTEFQWVPAAIALVLIGVLISVQKFLFQFIPEKYLFEYLAVSIFILVMVGLKLIDFLLPKILGLFQRTKESDGESVGKMTNNQ